MATPLLETLLSLTPLGHQSRRSAEKSSPPSKGPTPLKGPKVGTTASTGSSVRASFAGEASRGRTSHRTDPPLDQAQVFVPATHNPRSGGRGIGRPGLHEVQPLQSPRIALLCSSLNATAAGGTVRTTRPLLHSQVVLAVFSLAQQLVHEAPWYEERTLLLDALQSAAQ